MTAARTGPRCGALVRLSTARSIVAGDVGAVDAGGGVAAVAGAGGGEALAAVELAAEGDLRVGEGVVGDDAGDLRGLGAGGAQELEARRLLAEEVATVIDVPGGRAGGALLKQLAEGERTRAARWRVVQARDRPPLPRRRRRWAGPRRGSPG